MSLTRHALARCHQRGIPPMVCEYVLAYGRRVHQIGGEEIVFLDKQSRRDLQRNLGWRVYKAFGHWLDCAIVILPNGRIKTVFHRDARIRRD